MASVLTAAKKSLKRVLGKDGNPLLPARSLRHLEALRIFELELAVGLLQQTGRLLEIGAGAGWQARYLANLGFDVSAIDVASSNYSTDQIWPVLDYDGHRIPFASGTFDYVFSSNTLEHIPHVREFQQEIHRVLTSTGRAIHVVPSATWRLWTNITNPIRYLSPPTAHGEHASNAISEMWFFRRDWWQKLFRETGWEVLVSRGNGIFYTGCSIADSNISLESRAKLSRFLGSSCHVFVLAKAATSNTQ